MYERYYACLGKSKLKDFLNFFIRTILKSNDYKREIVDKCVKEYEEESKVGSPEFKSLTLKVISASVDKIANYGCVLYTYYSMGMSPRIIPQTYGVFINNTKKVVRDISYAIVTKQASVAYQTAILDLDLVSCFASILIGLHPKPLEALQEAIQGPGL